MSSHSHYHVVGVPTHTGHDQLPPPRKEIREFIKDVDVFNLYILANAELQKTGQDAVASWFQIGGIHGKPDLAWDGVTTNITNPSRYQGYCTHGSTLFPTWHRPYVSLYEQAVYQIAEKITGQFPQATRSRWIEALSRFRLPYWDWALDITLPDVYLHNETVTVTTPSGQRTIPNPLHSFKFNPVGADFGNDGPQWALWPRTLRYPTNNTANATSQPQRVVANLKNIQKNTRDRTYALLTFVETWEVFSNHTFTQEHPTAYDSVESIHDTLHTVIGGNGHMGSPDFAGFDPAFWLHHAQVDRLTALWQAINPGVWVTPGSTPTGTFMSDIGSLEQADSALWPFHVNDSKYWDSNACQNWNELGYTYPDFVIAGKQSPSSLKQFMLERVSMLYGSGIFGSSTISAAPKVGKDVFVQQSVSAKAQGAQALGNKVNPGESDAKSHPKHTSDAGNEDKFEIVRTPSMPHDSNGYREWIVNVRILKYAVHGSFFIYIFLGPVPEDSEDWATTETMVGLHSIFANPPGSGCGNCERQRDANIVTSGTIPLTGALIEANIGLDPVQVEPYLRPNLHWRVQKVDGTVVDKNDVPSLTVSVSSAWVSYEQGRNFDHPVPRRGDWTNHGSITHGRRGGMAL